MSRVIFLHGASSSGKSTLALAMQELIETPFMRLSFDTHRDGDALAPLHRQAWSQHRHALFDGLHKSFAAFANAGCDVILEHILDTPEWIVALRKYLNGHQVLFVGVHTPLKVLRAREAKRADRPLGSAEQDFATIHDGLTYDLELDGTQDPLANAHRVLEALSHDTRSRFFG